MSKLSNAKLMGSGMDETSDGDRFIDRYISKCCKSFVIYDNVTCKCSNCGREITKIQREPVIENIDYGDLTEITASTSSTYLTLCKRFATDPTYELCSVRCPKCKSLCRYTKSPTNEFIYICSNGECRHTFT